MAQRPRLGHARAVSAPPGKAAPPAPRSSRCPGRVSSSGSRGWLLLSLCLGILCPYGNIHLLRYLFHSGTVFKIVPMVWSKSGKCRVYALLFPRSFTSLRSQLPHLSSGKNGICNGSDMPGLEKHACSQTGVIGAFGVVLLRGKKNNCGIYT